MGEFKQQLVAGAKPRGLLQSLQQVAFGGGLIGRAKELCQAKMDIRGIGRIEQEQLLVSDNGRPGLPQFLAGAAQTAIGLGNQRIHRQATLGIPRYGIPIAGLLANKYDTIVGSMTITPEREKVVDFVGPYYHAGRAVFVSEASSVQKLDELKGKMGVAVEGEAAAALGLVTAAYEDFDWDDELRVMLEERTSFSPDAMTGMEANLRFAGPETMETKIFGRLTAWQNWIFQRPNAIGEQGALKLYGSGVSPTFNKDRV